MAARRLTHEAPPAHQRTLWQRSWWFWGVDYELVANDRWRAALSLVPGSAVEDETPGKAVVRAHERALQIIARSRRRLAVIEEEIIARARPPATHRGCCSRCDRCGAPFAHPGDAGCHPGSPSGQPSRCDTPGKLKRLRACAGCARPYEPTPRARPTPEGQYDFYAFPEDDPDFIDARPRPEKGDRKWTEDPRSTSIPGNKALNRRERRLHLKLHQWYGQRPQTRAECENVIRPCPFVSCAMNLYLDVNSETGGIRINFPRLDPTEMVESCALDIAERGGVTCEDLGRVMNISLEGGSQLVDKALLELREKVEPGEMEKMVARGRS